MQPIAFSFQFDFKTYLGITFKRLYSSWVIWALELFTVYYAILSIYSGQNSSGGDPVTVLSVLFGLILILHLAVYSAAKKKFSSTSNAGKEAFWKIDETGIERKNDTYFARVTWDTVYKIKHDKKWVYIYFNKVDYSFFPISSLKEDELIAINRLVDKNKKKS